MYITCEYQSSKRCKTLIIVTSKLNYFSYQEREGTTGHCASFTWAINFLQFCVKHSYFVGKVYFYYCTKELQSLLRFIIHEHVHVHAYNILSVLE